MKRNAWKLISWISLIVIGVLAVILAANSIAAENGGAFLPETLRRAFGIADMVCLFLFVFSRIKGRN